MKRLLLPLLAAGSLLPMPGLLAQVEYVDPTIGGLGFMLEPTRPTVSLPNSMVRVYPVRNDQLDDQIHSFPLTIISHRLGELFWLMPCDGSPDSGAWNRPAAYDQETLTPYYYSTRFDDSLIRTEFTPTERCGYFRFTFPSGKATVLLANRFPGELSGSGSNVVTGIERFHDMQAFVYGEFSAPVRLQPNGDSARSGWPSRRPTASSSWNFATASPSSASSRRGRICRKKSPPGLLTASKARPATAGTGAGPDRGQRRHARRSGAFFTPRLYRCYERMINITEDGQYYSAFDHQVHQDARPFYVDNWLWDTYRALEPLQTLLNPEMEADKLQSYVRMYEQSGWLPCFAVLWGNHACMTGNHAAAWMADAWDKGVTQLRSRHRLRGRAEKFPGRHLAALAQGPEMFAG